MHQQGLSKESRVPTPTPPHSYIEDRVVGRLVATANGGSVCGRVGSIVESPPTVHYYAVQSYPICPTIPRERG